MGRSTLVTAFALLCCFESLALAEGINPGRMDIYGDPRQQYTSDEQVSDQRTTGDLIKSNIIPDEDLDTFGSGLRWDLDLHVTQNLRLAGKNVTLPDLLPGQQARGRGCDISVLDDEAALAAQTVAATQAGQVDTGGLGRWQKR